MAATSEEYKIILRVEGEAQLAKLSDEVRKEEKALADLAQRLRAVGATQDQVVKATAVYAQSIASLNQQIAATQKQIGEAGGSTRNLANGLVQLGYAVDDAQYGIKGLANNIQPLLMAFGVGAGLAGVIGIVVTATTVLTDKWGKLMDLMGVGKVKTQAQEMEELAKATERTLEQQRKLDEYEEQKAAGGRLKGGMPQAEKAQRAAAEQAINEAGGRERLVAGIAGGQNTGVDGLNPLAEGYEEYRKEKERFMNPDRFATRNAKTGLSDADQIKASAKDAMAKLREKNQAAGQAQVDQLMRRAVTGDQEAMRTLIGEVRKNPGAFPPNAIRELQKGTPEGQIKDRLDTNWKNAKMAEGEDAMSRAEKSGPAWKERKMAEGEKSMEESARRSAEVQDYFNNITEGPDAETRAALERRQAVSNQMNGTELGKRRQDVENMGGNQQAFNDLATGLMMQGMSPQQVRRIVQGRANQTIGTIPGIDVTRQAVSSAQGAMFSMQAEQMMRSLGPRQVHQGFASFTDSVTSADPLTNTMRAQVEASNKANVILDQIRQAVSTRTFRAAAS